MISIQIYIYIYYIWLKETKKRFAFVTLFDINCTEMEHFNWCNLLSVSSDFIRAFAAALFGAQCYMTATACSSTSDQIKLSIIASIHVSCSPSLCWLPVYNVSKCNRTILWLALILRFWHCSVAILLPQPVHWPLTTAPPPSYHHTFPMLLPPPSPPPHPHHPHLLASF